MACVACSTPAPIAVPTDAPVASDAPSLAASAVPWAPRTNYRARLEAEDRVIHMAGQTDISSIIAYAGALSPGHRPTVFMAYADLRRDPARQVRELGAAL